ncbi:MAG: hypothetical protein RSA29_02915 [Clostridium sp.]
MIWVVELTPPNEENIIFVGITPKVISRFTLIVIYRCELYLEFRCDF